MSKSPAAEKFLSLWYAYVENHDPDLLEKLVAEKTGISSPAFFAPKYDRPYVMAILRAVAEGLEDFTYTKEWFDGNEMILEFEGRLGDTRLKGIDRITVNADGQMEHIEVLIRPLNGLIALAEHVKTALANAAS